MNFLKSYRTVLLYSYFVLLFLGFNVQLVAAQGIEFKSGNWESILATAKTSDQLIFVDVYTDWCTPCKQMDAEVFTQSTIGTFFNKNFINYKLDAEKNEGPALAKKYGVTGYPTYLFLKPDGSLVYKTSNFLVVRQLMAAGELALSERAQVKSIAIWQNEFLKKKNDIVFMQAYLLKRANLQMESSAEIEAYFQLIDPAQRMDSVHLNILLANKLPLSLSSKTLSFLIANYAEIEMKQLFHEKLFAVVELSLRMGAHEIYTANDATRLTAFFALNDQLKNTPVYEDRIYYEEIFYRLNKNFAAYKKLLPRIYEIAKEPFTDKMEANKRANLCNNIAAYLLKNSQDKQLLVASKSIIESAIQLDPDIYPTNFLVYHTYGLVLNAMGQQQEAVVNLQKALTKLGTKKDSRIAVFEKQLQEDLLKIQSSLPSGK